MALKIKELVKVLQKKDQNAEVEFVVIATNSAIVCMDIKAQAGDLVKVLTMFGQVPNA